MPVSAGTLLRLAALKLPPEAMSEVLSIIAEMQAADEARKAKDRQRKRASTENPRKFHGNGVEIPVEIPHKEKSPQTPLKETTSSLRSDVARASERPARKKPRSGIPPDWQPSEAGRECAMSKGMTDIREQIEQFRSYHLARGNLMADWDQAWRTWCGNFKSFKPKGNGNGHGPRSTADIAYAIARGEEFQDFGFGDAERPVRLISGR